MSGFKPGLTAEVEILIDRLSDVLQAPVQSFVERGGRHFAWVAEGARLIRKEVKIGKSNDQVTEIVSGLAEGEKVVQTPRTVIPKEIVQLEEDVPATVESATSGLKTPEPGQRGGGPPGEGKGGNAKGEGKRNFELGLCTEDFETVDRIKALFEAVWSGAECAGCRLRSVCPDPIGQPAPRSLVRLGRARRLRR